MYEYLKWLVPIFFSFSFRCNSALLLLNFHFILQRYIEYSEINNSKIYIRFFYTNFEYQCNFFPNFTDFFFSLLLFFFSISTQHTKSKIYYACGDKKYKFKVDEKTRAEMYKLRQTWNEVFPQMKLYAIDVQISLLDPAWPVTAKPPPNSIHFNPKFLKNTVS